MTRFLLAILFAAAVISQASAAEVMLLRKNPDPYGYPRPAVGQTGAPVGTSLFFQIGFREKEPNDEVLADSVSVQISSPRVEAIDVLDEGQRFAAGFSGKIERSRSSNSALAINIDSAADLAPNTNYTVSVRARSRQGGELSGASGSWKFTTGPAATSHEKRFVVDLSTPPVQWRGGFFTGFCKPSFCTSASNRIGGYQLMTQVREKYPRAWRLQRDFSMTATQHQPEFLNWSAPNVVRELETRRITAIERRDDGVLLRVQDFFGCQQYGIESNRPLAGDYHAGDEVLIADGVSDARAKVLKVVADSSGERALLVSSFDAPDEGWKLEYARPLSTEPHPDAPGLFPPGGCYLRKFRPAGSPRYYWGRIDQEWDIAHRRFGRRLVVNFTDAPGDLAVDGREWTYPKDYAQYHQVVRAYTSHLIERYGDGCLDFVWSVLNEPDLARAFWRSGDWDELQKFYDYTVDGVLRSFEDHGYDSRRVFIGGLEIGAIFGDRIEQPILKKFLCHCSPTATCEGALELNAAFADKRLNGKRSKRVEDLCRQHGGRGSPCDFISIHGYNASPVLASKLRRGKELALEIDPEYYSHLWVNCFESCPNWAPPPDVAAADSYLGNGYFSTWCADVARRQLATAAEDSRYSFGESILTFWPWPNSNLRGHNNATQVIAVDDDGDGKQDREETIALPILHFLALASDMGDRYWVLPEQSAAGHVVAGFVSRKDTSLHALVYTHDWRDVQSRSQSDFSISLQLKGVDWPNVRVTEYRFDKDHNSYYRLGRQLRDQPAPGDAKPRPTVEQVEQLLAGLASDDPQTQIETIEKATTFGEPPQAVLAAAMNLYQQTKSAEVRTAIEDAGRRILTKRDCLKPEQFERLRELSQLQVTGTSNHEVADGLLQLTAPIAANGASFLVIEPAGQP